MLLCVLLLLTPLRASEPPAERDVAAPAVPDRSQVHRRYRIKIKRIAANDRELGLILRAERAGPKRDGARGVWWSDEALGIERPWATTEDALVYYVGLIESYRRRDSSVRHRPRIAGVGYTASVAHHDRLEDGDQVFEDVDVVKLELAWSYFCGPSCGCGFSGERLVVFDRDGTLLAVLGLGELSGFCI
jgi:hypothetical protein